MIPSEERPGPEELGAPRPAAGATPVVSVVGLGKLGAPMAACFAARGFRTIGVDVNPQLIQALSEGRPPVPEPGLGDLLAAGRGRLTTTLDPEAATAGSDVTFLAVPTPSEPEGGFSLRYVLPACEAVGRAVGRKPGPHLVVLTSTVMPGSTGGEVRHVLERASGRRVGKGLGLCYSPEFIALGSVIRDFLRPDFVLIGESDPETGERLAGIYRAVCENNPPVARMNFVNAELAKLAVNTFVTMKIAFANTLAQICERLPGGDVDAVTRALGLDTRIGTKYLKGAVAYGGPCFPRDNLALAALARRIGASAELPEATDRANRAQVRRLADLVKSRLAQDGVVGILGLAYKPNTDVIEESPGVHLALALAADGVCVVAYDPAVIEAGPARLDGVRLAPTLDACVGSADVIVIVTPWEEFRGIDPQRVARPGRPRVIIDAWRLLDGRCFGNDVEYVAIGVNEPGGRGAARGGGMRIATERIGASDAE